MAQETWTFDHAVRNNFYPLSSFTVQSARRIYSLDRFLHEAIPCPLAYIHLEFNKSAGFYMT